jgi:hypothetical protein
MTDNATLCCELCKTPMTLHSPADSPVRYYFCAGCGRWVASNYGDELVRAGTARVDDGAGRQEDESELNRIKEKLTRWIAALDESDPYQTLGVSPSAPEEEVRARFHELAVRHHPDHGGDPAQMRRVLEAYDRIRKGPPASVNEVAVERRTPIRRHRRAG